MKNKKVLIIEDNIEESKYAQEELSKAGFRNFEAVLNLSKGLELMSKYDAVLSDLFFPAGNEPTEKYSERFLPFYVKYSNKLKSYVDKDIVLKAIQQSSNIFNLTPKEYFDKILSKLNTPKGVLNSSERSLQNLARYEKAIKIEKEVRNGTNLPLGIIASEKANKLGLPVVIVTSEGNHGVALTPIRDLIQVPYQCELVNGKKNWARGIESIL